MFRNFIKLMIEAEEEKDLSFKKENEKSIHYIVQLVKPDFKIKQY